LEKCPGISVIRYLTAEGICSKECFMTRSRLKGLYNYVSTNEHLTPGSVENEKQYTKTIMKR
jgi:hypothetical protein